MKSAANLRATKMLSNYTCKPAFLTEVITMSTNTGITTLEILLFGSKTVLYVNEFDRRN